MALAVTITDVEPGSECGKVWVKTAARHPRGFLWCWSIGGGAGPHVCDREPDHTGRCRCGSCGATSTRAVVST